VGPLAGVLHLKLDHASPNLHAVGLKPRVGDLELDIFRLFYSNRAFFLLRGVFVPAGDGECSAHAGREGDDTQNEQVEVAHCRERTGPGGTERSPLGPTAAQ
jgi:hypothetical protein